MKHIIKKSISLICILALSLTICVPAFAQSVGKNENDIVSMFNAAVQKSKETGNSEKKMYALLTNNATGHKFEVQVFKSAENRKDSLSGGSISQTYVYSIEKRYIQPYGDNLSLDSAPRDEWDDTGSVHGFLTLDYDRTPVYGGGGYKVLLTNVNGSWVAESGITLFNKEVYYACFDPISQNQYGFHYPSGSQFSYNTGFSHAVQESGGSTACGAHIKVDLRHGTSSHTWTFLFTNTLFDNYGSPNL